MAHIGFAQHEMIKSGFGTPVVDIKTGFSGMCRYGDDISIQVSLSKLGNSSLVMEYEIHGAAGKGGSTLKLKSSWVLVYSELTGGKPVRIPDELRHAMEPYLQTKQQEAT